MKKIFKCRLYPTKAQKRVLEKTLDSCRILSNHFLHQRIRAYRYYGNFLSAFELVHSQVLQDVARRVEKAFQGFFLRIQRGQTPGFPRLKGRDRCDSFTFIHSGFSLQGHILRIFGVGKIPVGEKIKTCTIRRNSCGERFVCFSCDQLSPRVLPSRPLSVGIDLGLTGFLATSRGDVVTTPKYGKIFAKRLEQAQRGLSRQQKGTKERERKKKIHQKVVDQRTDFFHKTANRLVGEFGFIAASDLRPSEMTSFRSVNRTLYDTAWAGFLSILSDKGAEAGRVFRKVNPACTSQTCSQCGHRQKMPLHLRVFLCPHCGLSLPRDVDAAINIERPGLESLAHSA